MQSGENQLLILGRLEKVWDADEFLYKQVRIEQLYQHVGTKLSVKGKECVAQTERRIVWTCHDE